MPFQKGLGVQESKQDTTSYLPCKNGRKSTKSIHLKEKLRRPIAVVLSACYTQFLHTLFAVTISPADRRLGSGERTCPNWFLAFFCIF